jgi:CDP-paratose 2-epimerase
MNLLVTGICGFAGSALTRSLLESSENLRVFGVDNFIRPGSELNRRELARLGVKLFHADLRSATDLETLPKVDWVIDAAANPSVLAGVDGKTSSRQLLEHNLWGTVNVLEYCKAHRAGLILLSTSRVYSIKPLAELAVEARDQAFHPRAGSLPPGLTQNGVAENFSTAPPLSLYGSTKLASECLALEYGGAFGFPVWINRCGVLAGAGQFGKPDQGIFSFWINSHLRRRPLKYIGFDGQGHQVRDCLHPRDLVPVLLAQMKHRGNDQPRIANFSGGAANAMSLAQLTDWCDARFGKHAVQSEATPRPFDIPWMVLDSSLAAKQWNWQPKISLPQVLDEIAKHAEQNPNWLEISTS